MLVTVWKIAIISPAANPKPKGGAATIITVHNPLDTNSTTVASVIIFIRLPQMYA
jgi:hypothetical protein